MIHRSGDSRPRVQSGPMGCSNSITSQHLKTDTSAHNSVSNIYSAAILPLLGIRERWCKEIGRIDWSKSSYRVKLDVSRNLSSINSRTANRSSESFPSGKSREHCMRWDVVWFRRRTRYFGYRHVIDYDTATYRSKSWLILERGGASLLYKERRGRGAGGRCYS